MPYLSDDKKALAELAPAGAGELNYNLTMTCIDYLERSAGRYADHATVVGALECAKLEFYRRALAVYEDEAILKNGDVYS